MPHVHPSSNKFPYTCTIGEGNNCNIVIKLIIKMVKELPPFFPIQVLEKPTMRKSSPVSIVIMCSLFKIIHIQIMQDLTISLFHSHYSIKMLHTFLVSPSLCLITHTMTSNEHKVWCSSLRIFQNYSHNFSFLG
jgi:hypothetical protein